MKIVAKALAIATFAALAACQPETNDAAENVMDAAENEAESLENQAAALEEATENQVWLIDLTMILRFRELTLVSYFTFKTCEVQSHVLTVLMLTNLSPWRAFMNIGDTLNFGKTWIYQDYLEHCKQAGEQPLSYDEFVVAQKEMSEDMFEEFVANPELVHPDLGKLVNFSIRIGGFNIQPKVIAGKLAGQAFRAARSGAFGKGAKAAADFGQSVASTAISSGVASVVGGVASSMLGGGSGGNAPPAGFDNTGGLYSTEVPGGRHHVDDKFDESPTLKFETSIKAPVDFPSFVVGTDKFPSMELVGIVPTSVGYGVAKSHFNDFVARRITNAVANNVNFQLNYDTDFNNQNLIDLFNYLFKTLFIMFQIESVIAYTSNVRFDGSGNPDNDAMNNLRNRITAEVYSKYQLARQVLSNTPIPPNMVSVAYWLTQNYLASPFRGSMILKFDYAGEFGMGSDLLGQLSDNLTQLNARRSLLDRIAKGIQSWRPRPIPFCASNPIYDLSFHALWVNSGTSQFTQNLWDFHPRSNDGDKYVFYGRDESVDGFVVANAPTYSSSQQCWISGVLEPWTNTGKNPYTNRMFFYNGTFSGNTDFPIFECGNHAHFMNAAGNKFSIAPTGYRPVSFISINSKEQAVRDTIDWIFHIPPYDAKFGGSSQNKETQPKQNRQRGGRRGRRKS